MPAPALRNAGKNLARLREISAIVVRHGFGRVLDRANFFEALRFRPRDDVAPDSRKLSTAERFRLMLGELGPTFVKLGQVLSSRADILPPDWIQELSRLQDDAPPLPLSVVRRVIEEGLGRPVEELFAHLDEAPLASASIAQVHAARLTTGEEVVVKVQRPGLAEDIRADLDLLYYLAQFLERVVEETGIYTPTGIVEEFEQSLKAELDFLNEAANVELFRKLNAERPHTVVPRVYEQLTCRTVLTLERLRGVKITDIRDDIHDREQVMRHLIDGAFQQVFVDGVFHGDPHPGNVFVLEGDRLGLIDFGMVGRLSKSMQETLIVLCLAIALKDAETVARLLYKVGVPDERVNLQQFRQDIAEILDRYLGLELQEIQSSSLINDIIALALDYRIKVPREYAILTKAAITIEGVVRKVYPQLDIVQIALPYAKRLLVERMSPRSASGTALRTLLQAQGLVNELPLQLQQILLDLEGGKFVVNARAPEMSQLVQAVRWLGIVVFSGLVASALIVGSFMVLAMRTDWAIHGVPVLGVVGLVIAPMIFGAAITWTWLSGRLHKISLRRWLGRS